MNPPRVPQEAYSYFVSFCKRHNLDNTLQSLRVDAKIEIDCNHIVSLINAAEFTKAIQLLESYFPSSATSTTYPNIHYAILEIISHAITENVRNSNLTHAKDLVFQYHERAISGEFTEDVANENLSLMNMAALGEVPDVLKSETGILQKRQTLADVIKEAVQVSAVTSGLSMSIPEPQEPIEEVIERAREPSIAGKRTSGSRLSLFSSIGQKSLLKTKLGEGPLKRPLLTSPAQKMMSTAPSATSPAHKQMPSTAGSRPMEPVETVSYPSPQPSIKETVPQSTPQSVSHQIPMMTSPQSVPRVSPGISEPSKPEVIPPRFNYYGSLSHVGCSFTTAHPINPNVFAVGFANGTVELITREGHKLNSLIDSSRKSEITCLKFSQDGQYLVIGSASGRMAINETTKFSNICEVSGHDSSVVDVDITEHYIYSISLSGVVQCHDFSGKLINSQQLIHSKPIKILVGQKVTIFGADTSVVHCDLFLQNLRTVEPFSEGGQVFDIVFINEIYFSLVLQKNSISAGLLLDLDFNIIKEVPGIVFDSAAPDNSKFSIYIRDDLIYVSHLTGIALLAQSSEFEVVAVNIVPEISNNQLMFSISANSDVMYIIDRSRVLNFYSKVELNLPNFELVSERIIPPAPIKAPVLALPKEPKYKKITKCIDLPLTHSVYLMRSNVLFTLHNNELRYWRLEKDDNNGFTPICKSNNYSLPEQCSIFTTVPTGKFLIFAGKSCLYVVQADHKTHEDRIAFEMKKLNVDTKTGGATVTALKSAPRDANSIVWGTNRGDVMYKRINLVQQQPSSLQRPAHDTSAIKSIQFLKDFLIVVSEITVTAYPVVFQTEKRNLYVEDSFYTILEASDNNIFQNCTENPNFTVNDDGFELLVTELHKCHAIKQVEKEVTSHLFFQTRTSDLVLKSAAFMLTDSSPMIAYIAENNTVGMYSTEESRLQFEKTLSSEDGTLCRVESSVERGFLAITDKSCVSSFVI
ncbi:hypothetical protein P9112_011636 [Eukaryota sp. TZLM1-RC]